jgi:hypothetical protein
LGKIEVSAEYVNGMKHVMTRAKVALGVPNPKQALKEPNRKTFLNRGSINTSHH